MDTLGYVCHPCYHCRCYTGKLISFRTALLHRHEAQIGAESEVGSCFLPMPERITNHEQLHTFGYTSDSSSSTTIDDVEEGSLFESDYEINLSISSNGCETYISNVQEDSSSVVQSSSSTDCRKLPSHHSSSGSQTTNFAAPNPGMNSKDVRFHSFMKNHGKLVGIGIKHAVTDALMDDLVRDATTEDDPAIRYKSFNGIRAALIRNSPLHTSFHPSCPVYHQLLSHFADGSVSSCKYCSQTFGSPCDVQYINVWDRLHIWLQSTLMGPLLFEYYQQGISEALNNGNASMKDFFSGSLFQEVVEELGGHSSVLDDIFLSISTDGVQPFESNDYTYWPVVATVLNLHPSERYKSRNLLPVMFIPGPNDPKDLTSFLRPFIEEIRFLSHHGRSVRLWNGREANVRVHLLFVQADLVAMKKLTHLKGHNGLVPCRFCKIKGVYVGHVYFPPKIMQRCGSFVGQSSMAGKRKVLWRPDDLPLRTNKEVRAQYDTVQASYSSMSGRDIQGILKEYGFSSIHPSPLLELRTIKAFWSFPPDIMHLLFENVAKDMVEIWTSGQFPELAFLAKENLLTIVSNNMRNCGTGLSSSLCRRPRGLEKRNLWKASEWKHFVLATSLVVLHECLPDEIIRGWKLFVSLVHRCIQWELKQETVDDIDTLAKDFFQHFSTVYYQMSPDRIRVCKYVYHLLLHMAESIRRCGPISMLAQWSVENFAGQMNRYTHARDKFAESVREKIKYQTAARFYGIMHNISIPFLEEEDRHGHSFHLRVRSHEMQLRDYELRHPRKDTTISTAEIRMLPNLRSMLKRYYETLGVSTGEVNQCLALDGNIVLWDRLHQDKCALQTPALYKKFSQTNAQERHSCFFSAYFRIDNEEKINVSYGKALGFLEQRVGGDVHLLVVASWASSGLHEGDQGQVFAKKRRDNPSLFTGVSIESIACISHPIGVVEIEVKNKKGGVSYRTYFIDDMREPSGLLSGEPWTPEIDFMNLVGLVRRKKRRKQSL